MYFSSRRKFVVTGLAAAAGSLVYRDLHAQDNAIVHGSLEIGASAATRSVPDNFIGLSYENMQLEDSSFFSPANKSLIEQFRTIAPKGVLRLGGNTSEYSWWKPVGTMAAPQRSASPWKSAGEPTGSTVFAITPQAIDNLNGFLEATGWTCIYGLNLGYGTAAQDIQEALYVAHRLSKRLQYFQLGNEVDLFSRHLRDPATWNVDRYLEQWLAIARAVQKAVPHASFGLPDVASDVKWLEQIATRWPQIQDKPTVVALSHHYYWGGPPSKPEVNAINLLKPDARVLRQGEISRAAAQAMGASIEWRMTEGNTVYQGGKDGVSDAFVSALWSADYLLRLMSLGYAGANLHGGSGHAQAVSVGGVFHGEALMADPTSPHPKPFYTPIANQGTLAGAGVDGVLNSTYVLEPVGYGMKFAAAFAGTAMVPVRLDAGDINATVYAARAGDGSTLLALINKEAGRSLQLPIRGVSEVVLLQSTSLESRSASPIQRAATQAEVAGKVVLPPQTAMLLRIRA